MSSCYLLKRIIKLSLTSKRSGPSASCASNAGLDDETSDCWITDAESVRCRLLFNGERIDLLTDGDDVNWISSITYMIIQAIYI